MVNINFEKLNNLADWDENWCYRDQGFKKLLVIEESAFRFLE